MDIKTLKSILSKVDIMNSKRIIISQLEKTPPFLESAEKTNDTIGWFYTNSKAIEKCLVENGLSWCYLFETAPNHSPCIYMFIEQNITKEILQTIMKDYEESLSEGRNFYYEDDRFSVIDVEQYNNSINELEKIATKYASDVFKVYEV